MIAVVIQAQVHLVVKKKHLIYVAKKECWDGAKEYVKAKFCSSTFTPMKKVMDQVQDPFFLIQQRTRTGKEPITKTCSVFAFALCTKRSVGRCLSFLFLCGLLTESFVLFGGVFLFTHFVSAHLLQQKR